MNLFILKTFFSKRPVRICLLVLLLVGAFAAGHVSASNAELAYGQQSLRERRAAERQRNKERAQSDLEGILATLSKNPADMTEEELAELAQYLNKEQAMQLFEALGSLTGRERDTLMRAFVEAWAAKDPASAVAAVHTMPPSRLGYSLLNAALEHWGQKNPNGALKWLGENRGVEPTSVYNERVQQIMRGWAQSDPALALNYALTALPSGNRRDDAQQSQIVRTIAAEMARTGNISEALTLFGNLPEGNMRTRALDAVVREWGMSDPTGALAWAAGAGEGAAAHQSTILRSWSESDPAAAAQWIALQDVDGKQKGEWMMQTIGQWARYDLDSPAQWLNDLPNSPEKDGAVLAFTNSAAREDPQSAIAWASQVSDAQWRDRAMAMVAVQWSREDPDALKTYIATDQSLTNQQRAILQNVEKNGMRALMQMGFPSTGIGGGSFNMRELRSLGIGGPGGGPPGGGRR